MAIVKKYATQARVSILKEDKENDGLECTLARCIRKLGRKLISLRRQLKLYDHYQIDLRQLKKIFALDCCELENLIKNASNCHLPEFSDYEFEVRVIANQTDIPNPNVEVDTKISELEEFYRILQKFKDVKFNNDIDLSLQFKFADFCRGRDTTLDYTLPFKTLSHVRQKNQLKKDIERLKDLGQERTRDILQILLGNNSANKWRDTEISGKYREYDHRELIPHIEECLRTVEEDFRESGWVFKKLKQ